MKEIRFTDRICDAFARSVPNHQFQIRKELSGGYSSSQVYLVEIIPKHKLSVESTELAEGDLAGNYVLKAEFASAVTTGEDSEAFRHDRARNISQPFSDLHIPQLIRVLSESELSLCIYEVAGKSFLHAQTLDLSTIGFWTSTSCAIAKALLSVLNSRYRIEPNISESDTVRAWLGHKLDATTNSGRRLHDLASKLCGVTQWYPFREKILVNPYWLARSSILSESMITTRLSGFIHGDLHQENILRNRMDPRVDGYSIIDFAESRSAPLFFDHSYLEFDLIRRRVGGNEARLFQVLQAVDADKAEVQNSTVHWEDAPLVSCLRAFRSEINAWQQSTLPDYRPIVDSQVLLSRVAAGLNWASKDLESARERESAFAYAAWSASQYLQNFQHDEAEKLYSQAKMVLENEPYVDKSKDNTADQLCNHVFEILNRFDPSNGIYVLITGKLSALSKSFAALGLLPWSHVIDFDESSDDGGLFSVAAIEMRQSRSVHQFGIQPVEGSVTRGTAWIMANGWKSHGEESQEDDLDWARLYVPILTKRFQEISKATSNAIKIVIAPFDGIDEYRLRRTAETILENLSKGQAEIVSIGQNLESNFPRLPVAITEGEFTKFVGAKLGSSSESITPRLPSLRSNENGSKEVKTLVALEVTDLRFLEEDFDVLHSDILRANPSREIGNAFWRGGAITWRDLHANADVKRDVSVGLESSVRQALNEHRNFVIELWHNPGAGGSTVAKRLGWNLKDDFPVVILNRLSKYTVERISLLSAKTKLPILLISDENDLSAKARDELHRELVGRNHRVVIAHVLRTLRKPSGEAFFVSDPMTNDEPERFLATYRDLCMEDGRSTQLTTITRNDEYKKYRSPFFYALITYENDFKSLDGFVRARAAGLGPVGGRALEFLCLSTRFASGIESNLFKRMLGLRFGTTLDLEATFGTGPASLIFQDEENVRVVHPLIAEEFLQQRMGSDEVGWDDKLNQLSKLFVTEVVSRTKYDSDECRKLFYDMFIKRDTPARFDARRLDQFDEIKSREQFSPLVQRIKVDIDRQDVFLHLTDCCPTEAHYFNHLGRHRVFALNEGYEQAERDLEKAVELSPNDPIHHHTLGLVRRQWIYEILDQMMRTEPRPKSAVLLSAVFELSEKAKLNFDKARDLAPYGDHGYVTQIQMITKIVERLLQTGDLQAKSIQELQAEKSVEGNWVRANLVQSQDLLDAVERRYGGSDLTSFVVACRSSLLQIHGDHKAAIERWERFLDEGPADVLAVRRNLANAYKNARLSQLNLRGNTEQELIRWPWPHMGQAEKRRVAELMSANLDEDPTSERDIRMWFAAYRYLPEFSFLDAISRLERWAVRSNSPDPHFYLFALHFLRWHSGIEENGERVIAHCKQATNLTLVNPLRGHSFEWLGLPSNDNPCNLVNNWQVGDLDVVNESSKDLVRVSGVISKFDSPRRARIRIHSTIPDVFFVPRDFFSGKDEGEFVTFFLGFTYEGLRAHTVELGRGSPLPRDVRRTPSVSFSSKQQAGKITPSGRLDSLEATNRTRARQLAIDFVNAALVRGPFVPVNDVHEHVAEKLGSDSALQTLGYVQFTDLLNECPELSVAKVNGVDMISKPRSVVAIQKKVDSEFKGTVIKYSVVEGFGFIKTNAVDQDLYVNCSDIISLPRELAVGDSVTFVLGRNNKGVAAKRVKRQ